MRNTTSLKITLILTSLLAASTVTAIAQTQSPVELGKQLVSEATAEMRTPNPEGRRRSITKLTEARRLFAEAGDSRLELQAIQLLARNLSQLNDSAGALAAHREILELATKLNDRPSIANALVNIAYLETGNGNLEKARAAAEEARKIGIELGSKQIQAQSEEAFANIFQKYDNLPAALESIEKAIAIYRETGSKMQEALGLRTIANIRGRLGETKEAIETVKKALALIGDEGDARLQSQLLYLLGQLSLEAKDFAGAEEFLKGALKLSGSDRDVFASGRALMALGRVGLAKKDFAGALVNLQSAKDIFENGGNVLQRSLVLSYIGAAYSGMDRSSDAMSALYESLFLTRLGDAQLDAAERHIMLSETLRRFGKPALAVAHAKEAVNLLQKVRSRIASEDDSTRRNFIANSDSAYRHLASLLIDEGRLEEALTVINLFKDQQYLDFSGESTSLPGIVLSKIESDFIAALDKSAVEFRDNEQRLSGLRRRGPANPQPDAASQIAEINAKGSSIVAGTVKLLESDEWKTRNPSTDATVDAPFVRSLQTTLASAAKSGEIVTAAVTLLGAEDFYVLIVTPDSIRSVTSKNVAERVNRSSRRLWSILQSDEYDPTGTAKELYDLVFKPIEKEIPKGTTTLLWGLDGNLRYVPMTALYDGQRYLIERYRSAQFTRNDRISGDASRIGSSGVGFGSTSSSVVQVGTQKIAFSSLPGVDVELSQIFLDSPRSKKAIGGVIFKDSDFTKDRFFSELGKKKSFVHIASHFAFRPGDSTRSFLLMGDGSPLTLAELRSQSKLFDGVSLLTLSACSTAAQQRGANGNEIDALAETAHRLGARSIVASLWEVSDASTPFLMRDLYSSIGQRGSSKADALRTAQLNLLNGKEQSASRGGKKSDATVPKTDTKRADLVLSEPIDAPAYKQKVGARFAHPHYWASFILIGDWR